MTQDHQTSLPVLRERRAWSRAELAGRLDVSARTVGAIERGRYAPSLPLALRIGRVFGVQVEEIFGGEHG